MWWSTHGAGAFTESPSFFLSDQPPVYLRHCYTQSHCSYKKNVSLRQCFWAFYVCRNVCAVLTCSKHAWFPWFSLMQILASCPTRSCLMRGWGLGMRQPDLSLFLLSYSFNANKLTLAVFSLCTWYHKVVHFSGDLILLMDLQIISWR